LFRSGSIDQNRSSANWPLAKILQRHGDAETGFNEGSGSRACGFSVWGLGFQLLGLLFHLEALWLLGWQCAV